MWYLQISAYHSALDQAKTLHRVLGLKMLRLQLLGCSVVPEAWIYKAPWPGQQEQCVHHLKMTPPDYLAILAILGTGEEKFVILAICEHGQSQDGSVGHPDSWRSDAYVHGGSDCTMPWDPCHCRAPAAADAISLGVALHSRQGTRRWAFFTSSSHNANKGHILKLERLICVDWLQCLNG